MFSQNGRISEKQMRRMLVLPVYASLLFVVPYLSAWLFGENIVPGLLIFFVLACVYVGIVYGIAEWLRNEGEKYGISLYGIFERSGEEIEKDFQKAEQKLDGMNPAGCLLILLQALRLIVRLAFYICLAIEVLKEGQVPFMPHNVKGNVEYLMVVIPLLLVAMYAANTVKQGKEEKSIEKQGRIYEMLFWLLFVPMILVLIFGMKEMDASVFVPVWSGSFGRLLLRGYLLLAFLIPVENYLLLRPFLREQNWTQSMQYTRRSFFAVVGTIGLVCVLALFMIGIYGVQGAGQEEMLTVAIMRYIRLPLGVIERADALLVWFFVIGCFVLVGQTMYFAGLLLSTVFYHAKRIWLLLVILVVALIIVVFLPPYGGALWLYQFYGAVMDLPLSVILPLLWILVIGAFCSEKEGLRKEEDDE